MRCNNCVIYIPCTLTQLLHVVVEVLRLLQLVLDVEESGHIVGGGDADSRIEEGVERLVRSTNSMQLRLSRCHH